MPSEKVLQTKKALVAGLIEKLNGSVAGVLVDYKGINVEDDTKLRKELREAGIDYFVVKNTMLRFAIKEAGLGEMDTVLEGTTAIALSKEDPVAAAKILAGFAEKKKDFFTIKSGFVDGKVVSVDEVNALAKLPSKEVLLAQALGGLNAPISGFVNVLNANIRGLVIALDQISKKSA